MSTPFYDIASLVVVPSGYKASKVYAQKPQTTDGQLAFTRASTATRVNASGLVASVASGVPRLDYLNSSCPKLLLEPQRSNLALNSESFDNATWIKQNGSVTANTTVSPDGYTNADTFTSDSTTGEHNAYSTTPITISSSAFTTSCYVKPLTGRYFCLSNYQAGQNYSAYATFDLQTGTTVATGAPFGTYISNSIQSVGNGWYRVSVTGSGVTSNFVGLNAMTAANFNPSVNTAGQGQSYAIYGVQLEQGAYATSYIPTTTAAVTRVADAAFKTGISSLIGQTEGTIFVEMQRLNTGAFSGVVALQLNDGTNNNRIQIELSVTGAALLIASSGGAVVANITGPTLTLGQTSKIAVSYKVNDFKIFVNGVLAGSDTSGAAPVSMSRLDLASEVGTSYSGYALAQALVFKTSLTNAQLAELTTI